VCAATAEAEMLFALGLEGPGPAEIGPKKRARTSASRTGSDRSTELRSIMAMDKKYIFMA
jgi:hypothetical protein